MALRRADPALVALAALVLLCAAWVWSAERGLARVFERAELASVDLRFQLRGARPPHRDHVVIVGLDDALRARHPEALEARDGTASILRAIAAAHPKAIAVDLYFEAPEHLVPPALVSDADAAATGLAAEKAPSVARARAVLERVVDVSRGDERLAAAIASAGNVVLAVLLDADPPAARADAPMPAGLDKAELDEGAVVDNPDSLRPLRAGDYVGISLPTIARAAARAGHADTNVALDRVSRSVDTVIERAGHLYAALPISAVAVAEQAETSYLVGAPEVHVGAHVVPVNPRANALVDFYGRAGAIPTVSAADLLDGKVPRAALEGKIVFVGYTDAARDEIYTPFEPRLHGVEMHATVAENVLHGEFLHGTAPRTAFLLMLALGAIAVASLLPRVRRRPGLVLVVLVVLTFGWIAIAIGAFFAGRVLPLVAPALAVIVPGAAGLATVYLDERDQKLFIRRTFSQYLSRAVVDRLLEDPSRVRLGGERRELTVLFSDIRGFSHISEGLEPDVLSAFLGEYFGPMSDLVQEAGGTVDKYIGDAVMAFWGAPLPMADHAARAAMTALAMTRSLRELNERWRARGLPEIRIGIGLSTGMMSVGNMGSQGHFAYTVLGDAVNLGSRLESLTKEYGAAILAAERTRELAGPGFVWRELDRVRVVGRDATVRIYELLGTAGSAALSAGDIARYEAALAAYRARDWAAAETSFAEIVAARPEDGPAKVMLERVRTLRRDPPADSWDGVYAQRSK